MLQDTSPQALAAAIEGNVVERCAYLGRWPRVEVHDDPDRLWVISDVQSTLFNQVARARFSPADAGAAIEAALAPYAERKLTGFWWTGPGDAPADLGERLDARGLQPASSPGMAVPLREVDFEQPAPEGLAVRPVEDAPGLELWVQLVAEQWELPVGFVPVYREFCATQALGGDARWRLYVALLRGVPVGMSSVFYGAGVAGIYHVGVTPDARKQGIGMALTLAPLRDALAAGYRVGVLFATPMALGLYRRIGFREYCRIGQRVFGLPAQEDVRRAQEALERLGYDVGGVDGLYGRKTAAAVRAFQAARGVHVDGQIGPQTHQALQAALVEPGTAKG